MKKRTSRLLSVLLTLVMVLGMLPAMSITALAANPIYISKIKGTATGLEPVCGTKITAPKFSLPENNHQFTLDVGPQTGWETFYEPLGRWMKWNDMWHEVSSVNQFTPGRWRYAQGFIMQGDYVLNPSSVSVEINEESWETLTFAWDYDYFIAYSPEYTVSAGTAALSEARSGVAVTPVFDGYLNELNAQGKLSFQWMRKSSGGSGFIQIPGATGSSYTPTDSDVGAIIYVAVWETERKVVTSSVVSNQVVVKASVGHTLNSVQASVTVPTVGASKEDCVPRLTTANMTIDHYNWYYTGSGDQTNLRREDFMTFVDDGNYLCHIYVKPDSTYAFADDATGMVNGKTAETQNGTDLVRLSYEVTVKTETKMISEVAVTGVVTPVDGAKPVETCKLGGTGYALKSMSWYDGSLKMNSAGTFQAGKTYRACFYLLPEKGYTFDGADSMTATVNGKTVEVTNVYGEPEQRGVTIDFTCEKPSKTISTVDITELDALKPGTAADYTASTSTAGCTVKKVEYQMFRKTLTDYVPADGEDIAVVVTVAAADGYEFAGGSTATWNGLKSDDTVAGLNANERRYAFYIKVKADTSQIVKSAAMTVTAPEIGKAPSTAVTGSGVEASDVKWSPADATFQAGTAYTVSFTLKADATHVLADDFKNAGTVTVNGQKATLTSSTKGKFVTYTVSYTFPALKAGEISSVSVTGIDAPAIGAKPDTSAEAGSEEYIIASVLWSPGDSKFAADKAYTVNLTLKAAGTNKFTSKVTATVNGQEAKIVSGTGTQELRINYTFPALKAGAPAITTQPKSASVKEGADVTFSVAAEGEGLSYQWYCESKGSAAKVGTNGPTYTIKAVNVSDDNGTAYYCVVSNKAGEVTSDKATLTVSKLGSMTTFSDVPEGAYYTDAVAWAVEKGVTSGTSGTTFSPNADCTRAQIVTFLWRAAGSPTPKSKESAFTDVAAGSYYETAVQWAVENGITSGTSATTFSPNATCTRAQTVTFLWRSQKSPTDGAANSFADVAEGTYYTNAVKWAVKNGITSGTSTTTFSPNADCSRAQIVTFLYRCLGK